MKKIFLMMMIGMVGMMMISCKPTVEEPTYTKPTVEDASTVPAPTVRTKTFENVFVGRTSTIDFETLQSTYTDVYMTFTFTEDWCEENNIDFDSIDDVFFNYHRIDEENSNHSFVEVLDENDVVLVTLVVDITTKTYTIE